MDYYRAGQLVAMTKQAGWASRLALAPFKLLGRGAMSAGQAVGRGAVRAAGAPFRALGGKVLGAGEGVMRGLRGLRTSKSLLGRGTKALLGKDELMRAGNYLGGAARGAGGAASDRFGALTGMLRRGQTLDPLRAQTLKSITNARRLATGVGLGAAGIGAAGAYGAGKQMGLV